MVITRREERDAHRTLQSRSIAQTILVEDKSKSPKIGLVRTKLLELILHPQRTHVQQLETPMVLEEENSKSPKTWPVEKKNLVEENSQSPIILEENSKSPKIGLVEETSQMVLVEENS